MSKQVFDLRSMQRNQLLRINKEELIDIILPLKEDTSSLAEITKKINAVMEELESLTILVPSPPLTSG